MKRKIESLLDTGATSPELVMARILADKQNTSDTNTQGVRMAVVHQLYDILCADLPEEDE